MPLWLREEVEELPRWVRTSPYPLAEDAARPVIAAIGMCRSRSRSTEVGRIDEAVEWADKVPPIRRHCTSGHEFRISSTASATLVYQLNASPKLNLSD